MFAFNNTFNSSAELCAECKRVANRSPANRVKNIYRITETNLSFIISINRLPEERANEKKIFSISINGKNYSAHVDVRAVAVGVSRCFMHNYFLFLSARQKHTWEAGKSAWKSTPPSLCSI